MVVRGALGSCPFLAFLTQFYCTFLITNIPVMHERAIFYIFLILLPSIALRIQIADQPVSESSIKLACSGAKGQVNYQALSLPSGIALINDRIFLDGLKEMTDGRYTVELRAEDSAGNSDKRVLGLTVKRDEKNNQISLRNITISLKDPSKLGQTIKNQANQSISLSNGPQKKQIKPSSQVSIVNSTTTTKSQPSKTQRSSSSPQLMPDYEGINKIISTLNISENVSIETNPASPVEIPVKEPTPDVKASQNNLTSLIIQTQKASTVFSLRRAQAPQQNQIKLTNAFNRQINAGKAVANWFSVVQKATANKNAALEETSKREQIYEASRDSQEQKQRSLAEAQLSYAQKYQNLKNITETLGTNKAKIQHLSATIAKKKTQKQQMVINLTSIQDQIAFVQSQLDKTIKYYNELQASKDKKQSQCTGLEKELGKSKGTKENKTDEIVELRIKLVPARMELQMGIDYVNDLKKQLAKAEKSVRESQFVVDYYESQQKILNQSLGYVETHITEVQFQLNQCNSKVKQLSRDMSDLQAQKLSKFNQGKAGFEAERKIQADKISQINIDLGDLQGQLQLLRNQTNSLQGTVLPLQKQLTALQPRIFLLQGLASDAKNEASRAKENLDAASKRFLDEQKKLEDSMRYLEMARSEKQLADVQVDELVRQTATVSLFPTPKSETSKSQGQSGQKPSSDPAKSTPASAQTSKNQSSSQNSTGSRQNNSNQSVIYSDEIKYLTTNPDGTYRIKNMPEFILYFFGASIKAPMIRTDRLYPLTLHFDPADGQEEVNATKNSTVYVSVSGYAISVRTGSFGMISDSGLVFQVWISADARTFSPDPQATLTAGSKVILKGIEKGQNKLIAVTLFCLNL